MTSRQAGLQEPVRYRFIRRGLQEEKGSIGRHNRRMVGWVGSREADRGLFDYALFFAYAISYFYLLAWLCTFGLAYTIFLLTFVLTDKDR